MLGAGGRERKEDTIRYSCQQRIIPGGAAANSVVAMQQFGQNIEWWEERWRRRWWNYLENLQVPLDRADGEMWRLGSTWYMRWIYLPKVQWQKRYFRKCFFFFCFVFFLSYLHGIINIKVRFPFNCPLGRLIVQWSFIESLLISFHWVKTFPFFLWAFTWNRPSSTQKFKK